MRERRGNTRLVRKKQAPKLKNIKKGILKQQQRFHVSEIGFFTLPFQSIFREKFEN